MCTVLCVHCVALTVGSGQGVQSAHGGTTSHTPAVGLSAGIVRVGAGEVAAAGRGGASVGEGWSGGGMTVVLVDVAGLLAAGLW